jgi:hypothetical protein
MESTNILDEIELEEFEEIPPEVKERFKIDCLDKANWAIRKLKAFNAHQKEIDILATNEIERIKTWQEKEQKNTDSSSEFFKFLLTEYLYKCRETDKKFKISTPYGKVSTKKQQSKWEFIDKELLMKWLVDNNENLIRTKEEPALDLIKKEFRILGTEVIDSNGEIVPGIFIRAMADKVTFKID